MVALSKTFNPEEHDSWQDGHALIEESGPFPAQMVKNEAEYTKDSSGLMAVCEFEIIDGPYKGRKQWERLLIETNNADKEKGVAAAMRKLKDISRAVGHSGLVNDIDELLFRPLMIELEVEAANGQYKAKNRIKAYYSYAVAPPGAQPAPAPQTQQQAAPAPRPTPAPGARPAPAVATGKPWGNKAA